MHSYYNNTGRRIFFWSLVVFYITIIGILIPFAFGYHFSFERGVFIYAGSVTIKTNPRDVHIMIDNKPVKNATYINNTYNINNITPGNHILTITHNDFQPFTKKITVSSGVSTEFWNVILPRTNYQRTVINNALPSTAFYHTPDMTLFATPFIKNGALTLTITDITAKDHPTQKTFTLATRMSVALDTAQNLEWSRNTQMLIIPIIYTKPTAKQSSSDALIVATDNTYQTSLRDIFPDAQHIKSVRWNPHKDNTLYAQIDNTLVEITLPQNKREDVRTKLIANDVRTYTIANDALYYLAVQTGIVHRITKNTAESYQITTTPTTITDTNVTLTVYDDNSLVIRGNESNVLEIFNHAFAQEPLRRINVRGTHFSDDGKKLLYWSDREISILFLHQWNVQPLRNAGDDTTIARFSTPIANVQWARDYEHVLYTVDNTVKLTSLDERGGRITYSLLKGYDNDITLMRADNDHRRLYITEKNVDNTSLFFINFPEKNGFF